MKRIETTILALAALGAVVGCNPGGDNLPMDETGDTMVMGASPRGETNPPTADPMMQIDRAGRPAISTATIGTFLADSAAKDTLKEDYNTTPVDSASFEGDIANSLAVLDAIDTVCGNQLVGDYATLAGVLNDDRLYLHADRDATTCVQYLGLEAEVLGLLVAPDGGCGGRSPDYDVIQTSYSVLVNGSFTDFDDGITGNEVPNPVTTFPYLAPPDAQAGKIVTLTGAGYDPHVGSAFEGVVHDGSRVIAYASGIQSDTVMSMTFRNVPAGSYDVYWYMDLSGDASCNAPPTDHVWQDTVTVGSTDVTVTRDHDTDWTDVCSLITAN